ncbi:MAG: RsmD family RNA methyltransferase [Alphaproteobacteria bacterium]|nr:RsmD family RNA methyltransferase [Alphaproteobacteria bacterium]
MDSKLQIISGMYRGRKLALPSGARPTQNRARMALFNMITSLDVQPINVWDAFAGSGAFGVECLSRYPNANVVFTDVAPASIKTVQQNLALLNVGPRASVYQCDALSRIAQFGAASDLIFLDPPYADHQVGSAFVRKLAPVVHGGTILIWEQEIANQYAPDENIWEILRDKQYGRARFLILQRR